MSALDSLVRLHRWQLDERRRRLADLDLLATKLHHELNRLAEEEAREQAVASASLEAGASYGSYARRLIERRRKIEQSLTSVQQQIVAAREGLSDAFQEMKRYEIAAANRAAQRRRRLDQIQQRVLDEIGTSAFRRRGRTGG
ncbi:MAG TPA: flagellar FliJ family protein [Stellaceae bacterium]|nr:flagellar FliJ family protein [Stellaceae bacterium]